MKKIIYLLVFFVTILLLVSCAKELGVDPVNPPTKKFVISVAVGPNVTASIPSSKEVASGASLTVDFSIPQGYEIDTVMVDGALASLTNLSYTFSDVTTDHKIKVTSRITTEGILIIPQAFVKDSIYVRAWDTNKWYHYKSTDADSMFFSPDHNFEILRNGKSVSSGKWSVSGTNPTIIMVGDWPWKILSIDEKKLWVILKSENSTSGDDIQYVFTRH
jgi:hypothetical protein